MRLADEAATSAFGLALAAALPPLPTERAVLVHLRGSLGAGKTTLVRALLRGLGVTARVRSPTYTLVEPYEVAAGTVYHLDLYRLVEPEELELLGLRDYLDGRVLCLVEWPERGGDCLPAADLALLLEASGDGRRLSWQADSAYAIAWLNAVCLPRIAQS